MILRLLFVFIWMYSVPVALAQEIQHISTDKVPSAVKEAFARDFPGKHAEWSKEGSDYRAYFTDPQSRKQHILTYDSLGTRLKRDSRLPEVPEPRAKQSGLPVHKQEETSPSGAQ